MTALGIGRRVGSLGDEVTAASSLVVRRVRDGWAYLRPVRLAKGSHTSHFVTDLVHPMSPAKNFGVRGENVRTCRKQPGY